MHFIQWTNLYHTDCMCIVYEFNTLFTSVLFSSDIIILYYLIILYYIILYFVVLMLIVLDFDSCNI
jgi:hypothetical protein